MELSISLQPTRLLLHGVNETEGCFMDHMGGWFFGAGWLWMLFWIVIIIVAIYAIVMAISRASAPHPRTSDVELERLERKLERLERKIEELKEKE